MSDIKYGHHVSYKNWSKFILIYLLIFLPIAILRFPDIRNEIKYFIITDNILNDGNWFILKYFSELYPDKPPLYFGLLSFLKIHFNENFVQSAVIAGSMIPSFLIVVLSYDLFAKLEDEKTGFMTAIFLCSIPFFIGTSVFLRMDMLMTFFIFMALYKFFKIYYGIIKNNFYNILMIYFYIILAILTKGVVGFMVPVITIIIFLILEKRINFLKSIYFFQGILFIFGIIFLWLGIVWFQPEGKEYVSLLLGRETVGRVIKSKAHIKPFYYYLEMLPLLLYPYGILALSSIIYYLKDIKNSKNWNILEKIGFSWTIMPFIFFSLASGKLDIYLLPIFPGIVLLIVSFIFKNESSKAGKIILQISYLLSIIPIFLNKFFNKENNFYKKILFIPTGILILFLFVSQGVAIYNNDFTLKPIITILKNNENERKIFSYRFPDFLNCTNMISKPITEITNQNELDQKIKNKDKVIIIGRNKYENDLKNNSNIRAIYKNKSYCLYIN